SSTHGTLPPFTQRSGDRVVPRGTERGRQCAPCLFWGLCLGGCACAARSPHRRRQRRRQRRPCIRATMPVRPRRPPCFRRTTGKTSATPRIRRRTPASPFRRCRTPSRRATCSTASRVRLLGRAGPCPL